MAKYLLVYHGGGGMETDPAKQEALMSAWMGWFGSLGAAVVDGGNPVGRAWTVSAAGTDDNGGANPATGYSVLEAASMDAALVMAKGCPILAAGGTVELCETFNAG
ncbi:MAG: hypothetical protein ACKVVT_01420 [Dehalococcoidia bacterium]